jgi:hypothetical protein
MEDAQHVSGGSFAEWSGMKQTPFRMAHSIAIVEYAATFGLVFRLAN